MLVTIITDASHCGQSCAAGWSAWIISKRGSHSAHGPIKDRVNDSMVAESMAVVNALHRAMKSGVAVHEDEILIQTDCEGAIHHFDGSKRTAVRADMIPVVNAFLALKDHNKLTIKFRHVKGHTKSTDKRSVSQRRQDLQAKAAMRKAREALRLKDRTEYQPRNYTEELKSGKA